MMKHATGGVQTLLDELNHGDKHVRDEAFNRIAVSRDPGLLESLAERARSDNPYMEALLCKYLQNLPAQSSLVHLAELAQSANDSTRNHAREALSQIDVEDRLETLLALLESPFADVTKYALSELGSHRRSVAIRHIQPLLEVADEEISRAAFEALRHIDLPRSVRVLSPYLKADTPHVRVAAIEALGNMDSYRRWKRFLPCLQAAEPEVRKTAIVNLSRKAGRKVHPHLIRILQSEQDEEVAKLAINRMALDPDLDVARALIPVAARHANPQIRRSAGWVIEEMDEELLGRAMHDLLPRADEEEQAYILTKMGMREMEACGDIIASYLEGERPLRVRYAALEGLGFLRLQKHLPRVVPYIGSDDPMAAYVATLTAVQLIQRLSDCPELVALLDAPDEDAVALKQVILQFMIDAITWQFDDPDLVRVLTANLKSANENIRYLSAILLGKCQGTEDLVPPLLATAVGDDNEDVRRVALESLDQALRGDLSALLALLEDDSLEGSQRQAYLRLMPDLKWGTPSARIALGAFDRLEPMFGINPEEYAGLVDALAVAVFKSDPGGSKAYFQGSDAQSVWPRALGRAWLRSFGDLAAAGERAEWHILFAAEDPGLCLEAAELAVATGSRWALDSILERIRWSEDHATMDSLRAATRRLLDM